MEFEGINVQYIFNQAGVAFFTLHAYPAYKIENGKLQEDSSATAQALQEKARNAHELLESSAKRIKKNKRVPNTWRATIEDALSLALAAKDLRMVSSEWVDHLERAIRFLKQYTPKEEAISDSKTLAESA